MRRLNLSRLRLVGPGLIWLLAAIAATAGAAEPRTLLGHTYNIYALAFSPHGDLLASASGDETVKLWSVAAGHLRQTLAGHTGPVYGVAFSPDGRWLVSASGDGTVRMWDAADGQVRQVLRGHEGAVYSVAVSPRGDVIASGGEDRIVRLWKPAGGEAVAELTGHTGDVYGLAFSPDGRLLASGSRDKTIRLWEPATGRLVRVLTGHTSDVYRLAFSPDGSLLGVGQPGQIDPAVETAAGQRGGHPVGPRRSCLRPGFPAGRNGRSPRPAMTSGFACGTRRRAACEPPGEPTTSPSTRSPFRRTAKSWPRPEATTMWSIR